MDDRIRVSDADRDRVTARLREHFAEGRLTQDELDERISAALSAKTFGDLRRVMADLPEPAPVPPPRAVPPHPWAGPHWIAHRREFQRWYAAASADHHHWTRELNAGLAVQDDRGDLERLLLRLAIGAATDRLYVSFPRIETSEARARVPSFYALEIMRAVTGHVPDHRRSG